jgi:alpha-beta hydrolase superfamily lysophospholipase
MDFNIKLSNGQILRGMIKSPGEDLRAVVILVHGLGEHIQRYNSWARMFNSEKIGFAGVDLPGHGRSEGKRGHIRSFDLLYEMTDILINECRKTFTGTPLFLYGHSLGGGIMLNYLVRKNPKVKGAIVTSPWLKLSFEPDKSKIKMAGIIKNIIPGLVQPSGLVVDHISRDKAEVDKYKNDPDIHGKISVSLFHGAMRAATYTLENASKLKVPLLLMHGSDDLICSPEGSREFVSKTQSAELKIWEGGYHELHNEPFKKEVFEYLMKWINTRLAN